MEIKAVTLSGIKNSGDGCHYGLSGRDLFTGPNGAGKSAALEAVELAITGRVHSRGKSLKGVMEIVPQGTEEGRAGILVHDGEEDHKVEQVLRRVGGKNKEEILIDGEPCGNAKESNATRQEYLGNFPIMFDLRAFIDMSDNARRQWLAKRMAETRSAEELAVGILLAAFKEMLGENTVNTAIGLTYGTEGLSTAGLDETTPGVKVVESLIKMHCPEKDFTLAGLVHELEKMSMQEYAAWVHEAFLAARRGRQDAEKALRGAAKGTAFVSAEQLAALKETETAKRAELDAVSEKIGKWQEATEQLKQREETIEKIDKKLKKMREAAVPLTGLRSINDVTKELEAAEAGLGDLDRALAVLKSSEQMFEFPEDPAGPCICKACGTDVGAQKAMRRVELVKELIVKTEEALSAATQGVESLLEHKEMTESGHRKAADLARDIDAAVKERARWVKFNPDIIPVEGLKQEQEQAKVELGSIIAKREEMSKAQGAAELRATLEVNIAELRKEEEWLKHFDAGTQNTFHAPLINKGREMQSMINELLLDTGYQVIFLVNNEDLHIGMDGDGGVYVPFGVMCGGEQSVVGCAIMVALLQIVDPPLKVLLIEADRVDSDNLSLALRAMASWGGIDNILVATHAQIESPEGWKHHKIGGEVEQPSCTE